MQLTPFCLTLSCLRVSPDRSQFFRYATISLACEGQGGSTGWRVMRRTLEGGVRSCSFGWGAAAADSGCVIGHSYSADSGVYWCESDGQRSNGVNISITDGPVILESPGLPVPAGATVALRCSASSQRTAHHGFSFYKNGQRVGGGSGGTLTIRGAASSDEGLYTCSAPGGAASAGSWLAVGGATPARGAAAAPLGPPVTASLAESNDTSAAPTSCVSSAFRLTCYLVVGAGYLLATVVLGLVYRSRRHAAARTARKGSGDVVEA